jgi:LysM repeat protein
MSACSVLASSILSIVSLTSGMTGSVPPAQASARTARSIEINLTSSTQTILASDSKITFTSSLGRAAASVTAPRPDSRYVVQSGDTLSAIAARFAVRGGWPALFAANRAAIGPDPDTIHPGTVLALPGPHPPGRYTVRAGDTLSSIAAVLAAPGGWPALYAVNRPVIGPDPNSLRPGTVLRIPSPAVPAPGRPGHVHQPRSAERPRLLWRQRRQRAAEQVSAAGHSGSQAGHGPLAASSSGVAGSPQANSLQPDPVRPSIVLADYNRLVVTRDRRDDTIYVLRPPGADPRAVLRVARLVLAEERYGELARQLGLPGLGPVD